MAARILAQRSTGRGASRSPAGDHPIFASKRCQGELAKVEAAARLDG
jgi:hypothetical protein